MAPSRGRETQRTGVSLAALPKRTAEEEEAESARLHEEYLARVQEILGLPEEEETEEDFKLMLYNYNLSLQEEAEETRKQAKGKQARTTKNGRKRRKIWRGRRRKDTRGEKVEVQAIRKSKRDEEELAGVEHTAQRQDEQRGRKERWMKKVEFEKTRSFMVGRIRMCRMKRLGRVQRYRRARGIIADRISKLHQKKSDRMKEANERRRVEFEKKRRFIGDRVRMCRMKRLGKVHRYMCAKKTIGDKLSRLHAKKRSTMNEASKYQREAKRDTEERWKWIVEDSAYSGRPFEEKCIKWGKERAKKCGEDTEGMQKMWDNFKRGQARKVSEANKRAEYVEQSRNELIEIVGRGSQKEKISMEVNASIEQEEKEGGRRKEKKKLGEPELGRRRQKQGRGRGGRKIIESSEGLIWELPQQPPEDFTWRREKRRRELLEWWEAPPPGPPLKKIVK